MDTLIIIVVVILFIRYVIKKRNRFESLRRSVRHGASDIGLYIEKRANCLNDAMNIAKISYSREVEGIERLTAKDQLDQLAFLGQKYPALTSTGEYAEILHRAFALNADITSSKALVNGSIQEYNDAITSFPGLLVAAIFGYKKETFIDEENIADNMKLNKAPVDFSKF